MLKYIFLANIVKAVVKDFCFAKVVPVEIKKYSVVQPWINENVSNKHTDNNQIPVNKILLYLYVKQFFAS